MPLAFKPITAAGISFIESWEGYRATRYKDSVGLWTIGFGHLIAASEMSLYEHAVLSKDQATSLFMHDLAWYISIVDSHVTAPVTMRQRDALISLCYNIGVNAFIQSTLLRKLNAKDYLGAAAEFPRWCRGNGKTIAGLARRREAERRTFVSDIVGAGKLHFFKFTRLSTKPVPIDSEYVRMAEYAA